MTYTAYVMDKADREIMTISRDYPSKKEFAQELRQNGFAVKFISTPEKFNHDLETYCEKKERRNSINRFIRAELKKAAEKHTEETNEDPQQEVETMRIKKEFLNVEVKPISKCNAIRFDADTSFYITNCTEAQEPEALRKSLEKFVELLRKHGGAEILVESLEMSIKFDEFGPECTFNEIKNGGNAYEIEINRYNETSLSIYIRICEHQDAPESEPAADQTAENYVAWCGMIENDVEEQNEETAEPKKQYDVFYTNQSAPSLAIYNHKPDRWRFDIPPVLAMETENALYFCPAYYNIDDVVKFLRRNAARAANK